MELDLINQGAKITLEQLSTLEAKMGVVLPDDYKLFLLKKNGGYLNPATFEFTGTDGLPNSTMIKHFFAIEGEPAVDLETNTRFYAESGRIPNGVLPIAEDLAANLICLDVSDSVVKGTIYFWDHELELEKEGYENLAPISRSFSQFIALLHE